MALATQRWAVSRNMRGFGCRTSGLGLEQVAEAQAVDAVLLMVYLVVDAGYQASVGDVEQRHARGFVDAARFGFDDAVFDLVAHAQPWRPPMRLALRKSSTGRRLLCRLVQPGRLLQSAR